MGVWTLFITVLAYLLVSWLLFFFSSQGLSSILFWIFFVGPVIFGSTALYALFEASSAQKMKIKKVIPSWKLLLGIIPLQIFLVLFNSGDCAGFYGSIFFYQRLLNVGNCSFENSSGFIVPLWLLSALFYIGLILQFIRTSYKNRLK